MDTIPQHQRQSPDLGQNPDSTRLSSSLPADDGMQQLREQMHEIRRLAASAEDIAQQMHALMIKDYMTKRQETLSPTTSRSSNTKDPSNPYKVQEEDLVPTYYPEIESPDEDVVMEDAERDGEHEDEDDNDGPALGCMHYKRNVKVQCFDCHRWFPCRHCHDAALDLPFPHSLNRKKTENMLCMLCGTPQPAGEFCVNCEAPSAYYYCPKCKLWDNDSTKRIYHCDDCGICRRGEGLGKDYVHCKRCNVCITISTSSTHPCIERATDCDCPLCLEYLFSSSSTVVSLKCGHYMHGDCYKDLMHVTYRCPVCNKSAVNMELQWRKIDDEIRVQPMPEEEFESSDDENTSNRQNTAGRALSEAAESLSIAEPQPVRHRVPRQVWVGCNDCGGRGFTNFHYLGLKCPVCDGYNTVQMTRNGDANNSSPMQITQLQRQHDFTGATTLAEFGGAENGEQPGGRSDLLTVDTAAADGSRTTGRGNRADSGYSDNAARLAVSPARNIPHATEIHTPRRSYFHQSEDESETSSLGRLSWRVRRRESAPVSEGQVVEREGRARFLPYDFLQRFGRSLSPMRAYFEGLGGEINMNIRNSPVGGAMFSAPKPEKPADEVERREDINAAEERDMDPDADVDFWGNDGHFLSGEDDDGEEESDGYDSDSDSSLELEEEEDHGAAEDEVLDLPGHR